MQSRLLISYRTIRRFSSKFKDSPRPPSLPKEDQMEFERLQREAHSGISQETAASHPAVRETYPDFEGNTNPKTGEVGGPKQDPLRHGDYSFNGRVTDF